MSRILLVEDEVILRETLCEILELNNFEVVAVESGEKALKTLKNWEPDVIVSDVLMPIMSGFELIAQVKKNKKLTHKPFIFLSALNGEEDILKAKNLGADEFITKPFKSQDVIQIILKYIK